MKIAEIMMNISTANKSEGKRRQDLLSLVLVNHTKMIECREKTGIPDPMKKEYRHKVW